MRVGVYSNRELLTEAFCAAKSFTFAKAVGSFDAHEGLDALVIDENLLALSDLTLACRGRSEAKIFYLTETRRLSDLSQSTLKSMGIILLDSLIMNEEIVDFVESELRQASPRRNNLFVFYGADSKVGTTTVSKSVCQELAKLSERILYVPLDGTDGLDFTREEQWGSLENIRNILDSRVISQSEIMALCKRSQGGYYMFPGVDSYLNRRTYQPEQIEYLLEQLETMFDIVIIDGGSSPDLGLTVAALKATANRFLVATQQSNAIRRHIKVQREVLDVLGIQGFHVVINKYNDLPVLQGSREISRELGGVYVSSIPYSAYGWQSERDGTLLYALDSEILRESVERLCKIICPIVGMAFEENRVNDSWIRQVLRLKTGRLRTKEHRLGTTV